MGGSPRRVEKRVKVWGEKTCPCWVPLKFKEEEGESGP